MANRGAGSQNLDKAAKLKVFMVKASKAKAVKVIAGRKALRKAAKTHGLCVAFPNAVSRGERTLVSRTVRAEAGAGATSHFCNC